jgi:two-component system phosphate regulon response regulator PhoB
VVLLDLMLPGLNGADVCRELRADERTRSIPVLLMSAKFDESNRAVGRASGADDTIPKPFSNKALLARVRALLASGTPARFDAPAVP